MPTGKVYILKLTSGNYYIGQTTNVQRRWAEHISGVGAQACKRDQPKELIAEFDTGFSIDKLVLYIEDIVCLKMMILLGANKVIGGRYLTTDYRRASNEWLEVELERIKEAFEFTQPIPKYINEELKDCIDKVLKKSHN